MTDSPSAIWLPCGRHRLDLSYPRVMGILNVTPDSFSDGGRHVAIDDALRNAERMLEAGAAIIDVGGESTRPGSQPVSTQQELDRVAPVVERLVCELDALVSVDTSNPDVMRQAAQLGAGMLNDVRALQREGALEAALATGLPVCLMHMQGEPRDMQQAPHYDEPIEEAVAGFLAARVAACEAAGLRPERLLLDPGFGFGKPVEHNLRPLNRLGRLPALALRLLDDGWIIGVEDDVAVVANKIRFRRVRGSRNAVQVIEQRSHIADATGAGLEADRRLPGLDARIAQDTFLGFARAPVVLDLLVGAAGDAVAPGPAAVLVDQHHTVLLALVGGAARGGGDARRGEAGVAEGGGRKKGGGAGVRGRVQPSQGPKVPVLPSRLAGT